MRYLILYLMAFYSCFGGIVVNRRVMTQSFPNVIQWGDTSTGSLITSGSLEASSIIASEHGTGVDVKWFSMVMESGTWSLKTSVYGAASLFQITIYTGTNYDQLVIRTDGSITTSGAVTMAGLFTGNGGATLGNNATDPINVQGITKIGDGGTTNYAQISATGDLSFTGTAGIVIPHLMQSDTTDQSISSATAEQVITFDTDVHHNLIARTSSSRFTVSKEGSYLLTFSAIGICADAVPGKYFVIWMKKGGVNVANSSTYYTFKSQNLNAVITVTFLYHFAANDYFEFWIYGNDPDIRLDATAAVAANPGVIPAIPACPSIILTCQYVGKD